MGRDSQDRFDLLLQSQSIVVKVDSLVLAVHDRELVCNAEKTSLKRGHRVSNGFGQGMNVRKLTKVKPFKAAKVICLAATLPAMCMKGPADILMFLKYKI